MKSEPEPQQEMIMKTYSNNLYEYYSNQRNSSFVIRNSSFSMAIEDLKLRFRKFAIDVATLISHVPRGQINYTYTAQLIRCSSSTAANYRAACRAKSTADFINKLKIVEEEMDESIFFLELLHYFNPGISEFQVLEKEADQLLAITVASIKTARTNSRHSSFVIRNS